MSAAPKLRSTDIEPLIHKAKATGIAPLVGVFTTLQDILTIVETIETEDARRETARAASVKFRSGAAGSQ